MSESEEGRKRARERERQRDREKEGGGREGVRETETGRQGNDRTSARPS
eukprot:COSAG03_NODE_356_length_8629_cov_11.099965_2_plen_49_part_00